MFRENSFGKSEIGPLRIIGNASADRSALAEAKDILLVRRPHPARVPAQLAEIQASQRAQP